MTNVAGLLTDGGRLAKGEVLLREQLAARRAELEERAANTLAALGS